MSVDFLRDWRTDGCNFNYKTRSINARHVGINSQFVVLVSMRNKKMRMQHLFEVKVLKAHRMAQFH